MMIPCPRKEQSSMSMMILCPRGKQRSMPMMTPCQMMGDTYQPPGDRYDDVLIDEGYDSTEMEMDGEPSYSALMSNIAFDYQELEEPLVPPVDMYDGDGPCIREHFARKFGTIFGCVQVCGGMSYTFFKRLTKNSNEYTRTHQ